MAFHIKDAATDRAVRRLAKLKRKTLTATIREAVESYIKAASKKPGEFLFGPVAVGTDL